MSRRRFASRNVACPTCGAGQGEGCRGSVYAGRGHRTVDYHTARREAARKLTAMPGSPQPAPDGGEDGNDG